MRRGRRKENGIGEEKLVARERIEIRLGSFDYYKIKGRLSRLPRLYIWSLISRSNRERDEEKRGEEKHSLKRRGVTV